MTEKTVLERKLSIKVGMYQYMEETLREKADKSRCAEKTEVEERTAHNAEIPAPGRWRWGALSFGVAKGTERGPGHLSG